MVRDLRQLRDIVYRVSVMEVCAGPIGGFHSPAGPIQLDTRSAGPDECSMVNARVVGAQVILP